MTLKTVKGIIGKRVRVAGSLRNAAQELGVSHAFLADVLTGNREPGPKLLTALGLTRSITKTTVYKLAKES